MSKHAPPRPVTLREAHEVMGQCRPAPDAPLDAWLAYHRHGQALYAEIADVDRFHHHEALYWANYERAKVAAIEARIGDAQASLPAQHQLAGVENRPEPRSDTKASP